MGAFAYWTVAMHSNVVKGVFLTGRLPERQGGNFR